MICSVVGMAVHDWHAREREMLASQAHAMVHALGSALRTMSARAQHTDGSLDSVLAEMADSAAISGVALVDEAGHCLAVAGLPVEGLAVGKDRQQGATYLSQDILAWDMVDVGQCQGWSRGFRGGRMMAGEPVVSTPLKLFVGLPLATIRGRWQHDWVLAAVICLVALAAAVAAAMTWSLSRRSAAYSAQFQAADEERRTLAEINLVAAGLAHEVKNPLGVVRGTAQHLAARHPQPELAGSLSTIVQEIDRVTSRVNELLAFANPREPALRTVDMEQELAGIGRLLALELADAGLSLDTRGVPRPASIQADPELLRRLLFNLLHNAIRFAPGSGPVEVAVASRRAGACSLTVRDHGPGVPPELRAQIFSAYFTTCPTGTGLGLAVVRRIARAHGWTVACDEAPGGGALFTIGGIACAVPEPTAQ